jgi:hypothetical protein
LIPIQVYFQWYHYETYCTGYFYFKIKIYSWNSFIQYKFFINTGELIIHYNVRHHFD